MNEPLEFEDDDEKDCGKDCTDCGMCDDYDEDDFLKGGAK